MRDSKKAESFAGIIVGMFILSFVILGIANVLIYSVDLSSSYNEANRIQVLKQNLIKVIKNIDTSALQENEVFYIHKNRAANQYEIYTGTGSQNYKYIDNLGNNILDIVTYEGDIYSQILWVTREDISVTETKNQIVKASIVKLHKK